MFKLSQRADYGLILLSNLAKQDAGPVTTFPPASAPESDLVRAVRIPSSRATRKHMPISQIAKKNQISPKFLSQIAQDLRKAGILSSREGKSGGYTLAKSASQIKILDVLKVLDGELVEGKCFEDDHDCVCGAGDMWADMKNQLEATIGKKTVADLVTQ